MAEAGLDNSDAPAPGKNANFITTSLESSMTTMQFGFTNWQWNQERRIDLEIRRILKSADATLTS